MFQVTIWSVPPLLSMLVCVGTYLRIRPKKRVPGMQAILALLAAVMFWSGAQFTGSLFTDLGVKILVAKIAYFGIVLSPVAWFIFAISYTRRQMRLSTTALNLICIVPTITMILVMTNDWHHLVWSNVFLTQADGYTGMVVDHGPWFIFHAIYSYALLVVATTILAWAIGQSTGQIKPVLAVIFAPLVVCLANLFYLSDWNPSPWFDLTTLGFAAAAMILDGGVLRYGVLDSLPVVRDRVVEQLTDGVIVINTEGMVIDINPSALALLGTTRERLSNKPITKYITTVPLDDLLSNRMENIDIRVGERAYDVTASAVDATDPNPDVVLVFREVTQRRKIEQDLREAKEELIRLAHTDSLTGIHNRRFFMQRLQEETERVRRHGSNLSLLLFDMDFFKKINDTYGHDMGDQVLRAVADASMEIKRITDVAARIGGEEFALLLPETDSTGAVQIAQRLLEAIESVKLPMIGGSRPTVTASIGVATVSVRSEDMENVLNHADEALYKAKHAGRNQVCCADIAC